MDGGMRWAVPRPAPQWITTLREQVYDPTPPTTTGTGQSANEERQSNGNEKGGIELTQVAIQAGTQCTPANMAIANLQGTRPSMAVHLTRATPATFATHEILETHETLEILETLETPEIREMLGDARDLIQLIGHPWITNDHTQNILLPPGRIHLTDLPTKLPPPIGTPQYPILNLCRIRLPLLRIPMTPPIDFE